MEPVRRRLQLRTLRLIAITPAIRIGKNSLMRYNPPRFLDFPL